MNETTSTFLGLPLLAWIPLLPLLGALFNLVFGRFVSKWTIHTVAITAVAAACVLSIAMVTGPLWELFKTHSEGTPFPGVEQSVYTWIEVGAFKAQLAFRLDTLSAVMILIVTFVGTLIHIYSTGYMAHDPRYSAYFGYLNLFTGAMLILVLAANMPVMFIGWEGVGLCSFLLIGFWFENDAFATAGRKAFVVNRIGDFAFLLGMFLLFWALKDVAFSDPAAAADRGSLDFFNLKDGLVHAAGKLTVTDAYVQPFWGGERLAATAGILLFIGACGKSAQIPLYVWLPDAMAGPTPVSALIHAATMVTAGVYMVVRLSFLFSASTTALAVVATIGLLTALAAAFMAFAQTDLKKVLAYSTVSQLGFMFVAAGTGNWTAAIFHLGTHAFFKAGLFLAAGAIMHSMEHGGSKTPGNITKMGGLAKHLPITRWCFFIYCLAISGIVPFAGFFSKDEILGGAWSVDPPGWPPGYGKVLWAGLLLAAIGTAFYMWRLYFLVFAGDERSDAAKHAHESPRSMTVPLIILAACATLAGFVGLPHMHATEHFPGFTHALASWLEPSIQHDWLRPGAHVKDIEVESTDITTFILMGIALSAAVLGIIGAWAMYGARGKGPSPTVKTLVDGPLHGAYEASRNKLWVDEAYDAVFVRPFRAIARGTYEIIDRFVIDTVAVNGSAALIAQLGRISRWIQNGQVQRYIAGIVIGGAIMFGIGTCRHTAGFSCTVKGNHVVLLARPGFGIMGHNAHLTWDFANSKTEPQKGKVDPEVAALFGELGSEVTLWIDHEPYRQRIELRADSESCTTQGDK